MAKKTKSVFNELGYKRTVRARIDEIKDLYCRDEHPWIIGYSGGKDSSAVLQLVWLAISELDKKERKKTVYVISTDTLVENPIVARWVRESHNSMAKVAKHQSMPVEPHLLQPTVEDSFWVNLIGKGYPTPRPKFRWCTSRLKINPSDRFIRDVTESAQEAYLVLGSRSAESSARSAALARHRAKGKRYSYQDRLSPNKNIPNCFVYTPIEDWQNDDVWTFLMSDKNPWGFDNHQLMNMYKGATADGECPLQVDSNTPSCGKSRFGCWVCTLVDKDSSMTAMINNDQEKDWMLPLVEFRNRDLDKDDRSRRDFRRINGRLHLFHDRLVHGPYWPWTREELLRSLLEAQQAAKENAPEDLKDWEIITLDELREIRRLWVEEKNEREDVLPLIYEEVMGESYPDGPLDENQPIKTEDLRLLKDLCRVEGNQTASYLRYEMVRNLLFSEWNLRSKMRRSGLFEELEAVIKRSFYEDEEDALRLALDKKVSAERVEEYIEQLGHPEIQPISEG